MLEHVNVPSYVIDATGIIRWVNPAAQRIVGDVRGLQFTSVVSPEDTHRARELFARKVVGAAQVTDSNLEVVGADGGRVGLEVSSVPLFRGEHVVGVFGTGLGPGRATSCASGPAAHTTPGGGARTTRARPVDDPDRPGSASEQRDGAQSHSPHPESGRCALATRGRSRFANWRTDRGVKRGRKRTLRCVDWILDEHRDEIERL
jgi:PAS domain S-box-containing protein